jgi:hypothetical protein
VTDYYKQAGATAVEASCLAPITGTGKSAVNQAFEAPKPGEEAAAIKCVGSEARLRAIATALFSAAPEVGSSSAELCTEEGRVVAPISGASSTPPSGYETMSPEALHRAGWRIVSEAPSTTSCQPGS